MNLLALTLSPELERIRFLFLHRSILLAFWEFHSSLHSQNLQSPSEIFLWSHISMANAWKRDKTHKLLSPISLFFLFSFSILIIFFFLFGNSSSSEQSTPSFTIKPHFPFRTISPFDCFKCPQSYPVIANVVEGVRYPFLFSIADLGNLPDKPHKNIVRMLKGKPFRKPDISVTIQEVLEKMKGDSSDGFVVDVGANVGMASFAAAAMGFRVLAFEPVFENLQRICDGIYLNRVGELVNVFEAAASDRLGNITVHKVLSASYNQTLQVLGFLLLNLLSHLWLDLIRSRNWKIGVLFSQLPSFWQFIVVFLCPCSRSTPRFK